MINVCLNRSKRSDRRITNAFFATVVGFCHHASESLFSMSCPHPYRGFPLTSRREAAETEPSSTREALFSTNYHTLLSETIGEADFVDGERVKAVYSCPRFYPVIGAAGWPAPPAFDGAGNLQDPEFFFLRGWFRPRPSKLPLGFVQVLRLPVLSGCLVLQGLQSQHGPREVSPTRWEWLTGTSASGLGGYPSNVLFPFLLEDLLITTEYQKKGTLIIKGSLGNLGRLIGVKLLNPTPGLGSRVHPI